MHRKLSRLTAAIGLACALAHSARADEIDKLLEDERLAQTATAITIIFDNSGSMKANGKIGQAKRAFTAWLGNLPESYRLGLIHFSKSKGAVAVPLGHGNRELVAAKVKKLAPYGKTPICNCLKLASMQIQKRRAEHSPYERHVVVVFTDGAETVDARLNKGVVADVTSLRLGGVEVVGIGFHGQGTYMSKAVTRYFAASDEKQLQQGLAKVDAEVGDDSGIEVTEADLKRMQTMEIPVPKAPSS